MGLLGKADECVNLKRGLIIGLAVTSLAGAAPATIVNAQSANTIQSMSVQEQNHVGSTGYTTNIKVMKESSYKYDAEQNIITEISMPLNYVNPWYAKGSTDAVKAMKNYYYIGTVINSKASSTTTSTGYESLSEKEQANYKELKDYYNQQLKYYKAQSQYKGKEVENAKIDLVKKGIRYQSKDLPLIYQLITGEKFNYKYWVYEKEIDGVDAYEGYSTTDTATASTNKNGVSCKAVNIEGGDTKIAQIYKDNSTGRVYVKGQSKGTTTFTIKTTLSDNTTTSYKLKVTINSSGTPIKYKTEVNPLSYEGYCLKADGNAWLGYITKYGNFFSTGNYYDGAISGQTGTVDVFGPQAVPELNSGDYNFVEAFQMYKYKNVDRSEFMQEYVKNTGAFDMLDAGKSELEVYNHVCSKIQEDWGYRSENDLFTDHWGKANHYSLEKYLDGRNVVCADEAAISAGIADTLGFNYFSYQTPGDIKTIVILDGKAYSASTGGASSNDDGAVYGDAVKLNQNSTISSNYSLSDINNVELSDLMNGKVSFTVSDNGYLLYFKVSDNLEPGRFLYGQYLDNIGGNDSISTAKVTTNGNYGVLQSGYGDTRVITFHSSFSPFWNNNTNDTISFRYSVPYMERAYFGSMKVDTTKQLNLINSDWSDWKVTSSNSKIVAVNTTGKITMTGSGTATITLKSKSIQGLSINVLVSSSSLTASTAKSKAGTFYNGNLETYHDGSKQVIAGDYVKCLK